MGEREGWRPSPDDLVKKAVEKNIPGLEQVKKVDPFKPFLPNPVENLERGKTPEVGEPLSPSKTVFSTNDSGGGSRRHTGQTDASTANQSSQNDQSSQQSPPTGGDRRQQRQQNDSTTQDEQDRQNLEYVRRQLRFESFKP
jgi:hypothetical protein